MKIVNLTKYDHLRLSADAPTLLAMYSPRPWIIGEEHRTERAIRVADLSEVGSVEAYLKKYTAEVIHKNNAQYPMELEVIKNDIEVIDEIQINRRVGGLPAPQEGVLYVTYSAIAQAAARPDVVCPITIAHPETGFAIGAIGYTAFG